MNTQIRLLTLAVGMLTATIAVGATGENSGSAALKVDYPGSAQSVSNGTPFGSAVGTATPAGTIIQYGAAPSVAGGSTGGMTQWPTIREVIRNARSTPAGASSAGTRSRSVTVPVRPQSPARPTMRVTPVAATTATTATPRTTVPRTVTPTASVAPSAATSSRFALSPLATAPLTRDPEPIQPNGWTATRAANPANQASATTGRVPGASVATPTASINTPVTAREAVTQASPNATTSAEAPDVAQDATSAETPSPEAAGGEQTVASENFVSRRDELGKPRTIVPGVASDNVVSADHGVPRSSEGVWYKFAAGFIFLLSLGYIGYRHKQGQRSTVGRWNEYDRPLTQWAPPPEAVAASRFDRDSRSNRDRQRENGTAPLDWENELIVREVGRSSKRPSRSRATAEQRSRAEGYNDAGESAESPTGDVGFHDEIERRVRRLRSEMEVEQGTASLNQGSPTRRPGSRGVNYDAINSLSSLGMPPAEIARRLAVSQAEVRTYLNINQRS